MTVDQYFSIDKIQTRKLAQDDKTGTVCLYVRDKCTCVQSRSLKDCSNIRGARSQPELHSYSKVVELTHTISRKRNH